MIKLFDFFNNSLTDKNYLLLKCQLSLHMKPTFICLLLVFISCSKPDSTLTTTSFVNLSPDKTGIEFKNTIIENDTLNYFEFPYMYMGGGVSIGDINNDGLSDIYLTGNITSNKLYLNKGNMRFEDITDTSGVGGDNRWYTGTTMVDINNDGWLDIYVCVSGKSSNTKNQLFINNQDNTFTESAAQYGIDDQSNSIQATFFDYDKDGFLDLFVGNYPLVSVSQGNEYYHSKMIDNKYADSGHLYKNNGDNTFSDVTEKTGVHNFGLTLGVVASDLNNDGWQDLYVSNDFNVPDYFYLNNADGTFREVVKESTQNISMFGMGVDVGDFSNDGLLDIIQVDMTPEDHKRSKTNMASMSPESFYKAVDLGFHYQYMQNSLQLNNGIRNDGVPIFSNISRIAGIATTDWSWGSLFTDLDNDGWKDIVITNGMKRDVNNNDANQKMIASPFGNVKKQEYQLYPSTPIDNYVFKNKGDFTFIKVNDLWNISKEGFSNGVSYGDLDNDGDLDVVLNNLDSTASVFENKTEDANQNYIRIKLKGPKQNPFGLNTKVKIRSNLGEQFQELTLTRGFQSSVEPILHFGLGKDQTINEIQIAWPNNKRQTFKNVGVNQLLEVKYNDAVFQQVIASGKEKNTFEDITEKLGVHFVHKEDKYDDFAHEPLLPHKNSRLGPGLAVGDINNDGLDDFFIGNAAGSSGAMYIQNKLGSFDSIPGPWDQDSIYEDTGALLFDADNDADLDLYVVAGGNDPSQNKAYYQDRVYINTGNSFVKSEHVLPKIESSGMAVVSGDYDGDGDLDLFVGGRIVPGKYPFPAQSYLLRNDGGKDHSLRYTDVTSNLIPQLKNAGLVTTALWDDFDRDGKLDLILTGEWMPIRFFKNMGNGFEEVTNNLGFDHMTGWWNTIKKVDLDKDGDMDYLVGNLGLNYKYHASMDSPFEIYANDFDENGTMDIVLSHQKGKEKVPLRGRQCSSEQVPAIKKRFETYESFASASLSEIYGKDMLQNSLHYSATMFSHCWIKNQGDGSYKIYPLPHYTQFSSINAFEILDFNADSYPDFLIGGNLYNAEVETPRNDAGVGLVLSGNLKGGFNTVLPHKSRLFVPGEIKNIARIKIGNDGDYGFIFARNNDTLKMVKYTNHQFLKDN